MTTIFEDRRHAGRLLAERLAEYGHRDDVIVLALPRGGVPVAFEVARRLQLPLDVLVVRKLGFLGHEEYAMGAIASGGARVLNEEALAAVDLPPGLIESVAAREEQELKRREIAYRGNRGPLQLREKTALLVDDGIATGATMRAAARAARAQGASRIVIAVPTAPAEFSAEFAMEVDEVIALIAPQHFRAVGCWYESFPQVSDAEVIDLLAQSALRFAPGGPR
jgi:predicted phosphoribosyltransferase